MLGIPYMGSKRKLAKPIIDYIVANNPKAVYFYDLFGGGGAISFEALKRKQFKKVFYNELNTGVCELLKKIRTDGVTPEFYKWVSREEFDTHKNDDTWYGGLLATCWSFGGNQRSYLFSAKIEEDKRLLHEVVVNKCKVARTALKERTGLYIEDNYLEDTDIQKRRIKVMQLVKAQIGRCDLQQLQQLEQLQQLQRLERLQRLEQLEINNKSAFDFPIDTDPEETVIYLDPPYENTADYQESLSHKELYAWIEKNSDFKIYLSSYASPLPLVAEFMHRSTLSATANNKVVEKLFCNKAEINKQSLFGASE